MITVIIILAVLAILFLGVLILIPAVVLPNFLGRRFEREQFGAEECGIASERVTLRTRDKLRLAAWRTRSNLEVTKGTIIIISGLMNPSVTYYFGCAKLFADNGWDSLLIEMRARSLSEGHTIGLGLTEWRDVEAGVEFLLSDTQVKDLPILAMGTSMGGATVITAAAECSEIKAVLALSAFTSFASMASEVLPLYKVPKFLARLSLPVLNLFIGFRLGFDVLKCKPIDAIGKLGSRPLLLAHSTLDKEVSFSQYEMLLSEARAKGVNVTTFVREGDEHLIFADENRKDLTADEEFCKVVLNFLETAISYAHS